jgi:predicted DNA-binding protein (MmcQ/YjbR family)
VKKSKTRSTSQALQKLRTLCLEFPETSETSSWGHPNFRAGKRTFATFEVVGRRPSIAFRMDPAGIEELLGRKQFFATPYGRGQWVSIWADTRLDWDFMVDLIRNSYRLVASKRMIAALEKMPPRC